MVVVLGQKWSARTRPSRGATRTWVAGAVPVQTPGIFARLTQLRGIIKLARTCGWPFRGSIVQSEAGEGWVRKRRRDVYITFIHVLEDNALTFINRIGECVVGTTAVTTVDSPFTSEINIDFARVAPLPKREWVMAMRINRVPPRPARAETASWAATHLPERFRGIGWPRPGVPARAEMSPKLSWDICGNERYPGTFFL